jgi:hypothetical protein
MPAIGTVATFTLTSLGDLTTKETNTASYLDRVIVTRRKKCFVTLIYIAKALSNKHFVTVTALNLTS